MLSSNSLHPFNISFYPIPIGFNCLGVSTTWCNKGLGVVNNSMSEPRNLVYLAIGPPFIRPYCSTGKDCSLNYREQCGSISLLDYLHVSNSRCGGSVHHSKHPDFTRCCSTTMILQVNKITRKNNLLHNIITIPYLRFVSHENFIYLDYFSWATKANR